MNPPHSFLRDLNSTNGTFLNGQRVKDAYLKNGDRIQCGETILVVEVTTVDLSETTHDASLPKRPVLVMVECLNCGRREQAQASAPDEHLTFLCEDCRIELKRSPQAIPGYDTVKLLGRGGMGTVMLGREQQHWTRSCHKNFAAGICCQRQSDAPLHARDRRRRSAQTQEHRRVHRSRHAQWSRLSRNRICRRRRRARNSPKTRAGGSDTKTASRSSRRRSMLCRSRMSVATFIATSKIRTFSLRVMSPNLVAKLTDFGLAKSFTSVRHEWCDDGR